MTNLVMIRRKFHAIKRMFVRAGHVIRRDLTLLLKSPIDYFLTFRDPVHIKVQIKPYDPKAAQVARKLLKRINSAAPELTIHFVGSTALGITSINGDIDFLAEIDSMRNKEEHVEALTTIFGPPILENSRHVKWEKEFDGYITELTLGNRSTRLFRSLIDSFTLLKENKEVLKLYEAFKIASEQLSIREYSKERQHFFHTLIQQHTKKSVSTRLSRFCNILGLSFLAVFCTTMLFLSIRGHMGNPNEQSLGQKFWQDNGPFELSPERGRFALAYSLVERTSVFFSTDIARFATPDLGYKNGHYVSLFAPAVSFIVVPGYIIGKALGAAQVGSFAVISLFALLNAYLIFAIAKILRLHKLAGAFAAMIFLFGTPAFAYATTLYQHHVSTFLILLSIYILLRFKGFGSLFFIWLLCAMSIPVDYPNLFLMLPIGIYALGRIIEVRKRDNFTDINIRLVRMLTFVGVVIPLIFFFWFNTLSYGNPLQFSGTVPSVRTIDASGKPTSTIYKDTESLDTFLRDQKNKKSAVGFFNSRNFINGIFIHLFSPDRGLLTFAPLMLIGALGTFILFKSHATISVMLIGIIIANIGLYSMWDDPWGGWAFGSRYLIPGYSIMSIFLATAISHWRKNILVLMVVFAIAIYSVGVNTVGALASSAIPPKVEVLSLEKVTGKQERYSYDRGIETLQNGNSKSFVYQTWLHDKLSSWQYYLIMTGSIVAVLFFVTGTLYVQGRKDVNNVL